MDTTEELNGTYFYHGQSNLSAGELLMSFFLNNFVTNLALVLNLVPLSSPGNLG